MLVSLLESISLLKQSEKREWRILQLLQNKISSLDDSDITWRVNTAPILTPLELWHPLIHFGINQEGTASASVASSNMSAFEIPWNG